MCTDSVNCFLIRIYKVYMSKVLVSILSIVYILENLKILMWLYTVVYLYTIYTENILVYILYIYEYWCDFTLCIFIHDIHWGFTGVYSVYLWILMWLYTVVYLYTIYTKNIPVYILYILQYHTWNFRSVMKIVEQLVQIIFIWKIVWVEYLGI